MSSFYSSQLLIKGSNSVLTEREIQEMIYQLKGIFQNISISACNWFYADIKSDGLWEEDNKKSKNGSVSLFLVDCILWSNVSLKYRSMKMRNYTSVTISVNCKCSTAYHHYYCTQVALKEKGRCVYLCRSQAQNEKESFFLTLMFTL